MALDTLDTIEVARAEIAQIYIAAFNRVPDAAGLSNWMNQYMAGKMTYAQIAEDFTRQPEYTAKYPSIMTNTEYVTEIYNNVFGRTPDAGGLVNWVNQLDHTSITGINRGNIMTYMLASAGAPGNTDGVRLDNQAAFAVQSILDGVPEATATAQLANITADAATVTAATAAVSGEAGAVLGQTISLTTGVDTKVGGANNDTFNAVVDGADSTFTVLDTIDGAGGNDTLNIVNAAATALAMPASVSVANVETVNIRSAGDVGATGAGNAFDVSDFTDVVTLNITQAKKVFVEAAATTNINVSGATDAIQVNGGKNVVVTDATAGNNITIGATTAAAGTITVTDTKQTSGIIAVDGGTVINVTVNANNVATVDTAGDDIVIGTIAITGDDNTTSVTVTQNDNTQTFTSAEVAEVKESTTITFKAMASGETLTVTAGNSLTFTATKALTAAEVAEVFAGLVASDRQDAGGKVANGYYTG